VGVNIAGRFLTSISAPKAQYASPTSIIRCAEATLVSRAPRRGRKTTARESLRTRFTVITLAAAPGVSLRDFDGPARLRQHVGGDDLPARTVGNWLEGQFR